MQSPRRRSPLSPSTVDELIGAMVASTLVAIDPRKPFLDEIHESDAATCRGAVVRAEVSPATEASLWARVGSGAPPRRILVIDGRIARRR